MKKISQRDIENAQAALDKYDSTDKYWETKIGQKHLRVAADEFLFSKKELKELEKN